MNKNRKKWITLLILTLVMGVILVLSVSEFFEREGGISFDGMIRAETLYIIIIFLILIPVLLGILLAVMLFGKNKESEDTSDTTVNFSVLGADGQGALENDDSKDEENGERFCMLSEIDRNSTRYGHQSYEKGVDLESFCEDFRNYAASKLKLYYDIDDIRRFVAGLAVSKLVILQGMSGTGKTSLAHAFGSFIDNSSTVIPVQPMWKERTDLIGYYNEFTKRFNETLLLEKMYEANYSKDMYITVLDEMNIARVEYYFAEFLSLLEIKFP